MMTLGDSQARDLSSPRGAEPAGRQRELTWLWDRFQQSSAGHTHVVLIAGEPGIGKTRVLNAIVGRAALAGARVLWGGASEAEGMPPYLPFLEALGRYIEASNQATLQAQLGTGAAVLKGIFPELSLRIVIGAQDYPLPPEQARLRLYDAVGSFLAAIAETSPLVLVLDDLQWADPASLDLLCHVARQRPAARLLILGAYRDGEVAQNPALARAMAELNRQRLLSNLTLHPLHAEALAMLATDYLGRPVSPDLPHVLAEHSEGNPFFAEELLGGWLESGDLTLVDGVWRLVRLGNSELPPSLIGAIQQRLARLPESVVELLRIASIIGRTFDAGSLAAVAGQEPDLIEEELLVAARARVIRSETGQDGLYHFAHDKIRECLYLGVSSYRRRRLHGFIGHVLETGISEEPPDARRLAELAFHFSRSGDRERGSLYAEQAAQRSLASYAFEESVRLYQTSLELERPDSQRRASLLLNLGESAVLASVEDTAVEAFTAARDVFTQAGDTLAAGRALYGLGTALARLERADEARVAFESALALMDGHKLAEEIQVRADLATLVAVSLGQNDAGILQAQRALELAQDLSDRRLEAIASRTIGNLLVRRARIEAGIPLLERALELAALLDDPVEAAECCACLVIANLWRGEIRRTREVCYRQLEFAQRSHDLYQLRHVYSWLSGILAMSGEWSESNEMSVQARMVAGRLRSPEPLAFLDQMEAIIAYVRGEYADSVELFRRAMPVFRALGPTGLVWYLGPYALSLLLAGQREEALECAAELDRMLDGQPVDTMMIPEAVSCLGLIAVELHDVARATRYGALLEGYRGYHANMFIDYVLGRIALLKRDWEEAQTCLTASLNAAKRNGLIHEEAQSLIALAELDVARGDADNQTRARGRLVEARTLYTRLGLPAGIDEVDTRLQQLSGPAANERPRLPAGLSAREAEVLRFVAAGLSNRAIATKLFISEKTVANHLTSIFNKIAVDNRVAATAFAIRHDLG